MMTNKEREQLIKNDLRDYHTAKRSGDLNKIARAIHNMENTYIAVCLWSVPGSEELRQVILAAKEA